MELHNVTKNNAKTLFTLLLYGGSHTHRVKKWDREGVQAQPIKTVQRLEKELKELRRRGPRAPTYLAHLVGPIMACEKGRVSNLNKDRTKTPEEARRSTWSLGGRGAGRHPEGGGGGGARSALAALRRVDDLPRPHR